VRRDKEKEHENGSGREPDEETCARRPAVEFGREFFGAHSTASAFDADNRHRSLYANRSLDFDTDIGRQY
jgi:hypothetical protein